MNIGQLDLLNELFGYVVVVDGDTMIGSVYMGDTYLYDVELV